MHYRVKKRWAAIAVSFVFLFASLVWWSCFHKKDEEGYRRIQERANPQVVTADHAYQTSQKKIAISKEFWLGRQAQHCFSRVYAREGALVYEKYAGKERIVEKLYDVHGVVQSAVHDAKKQELYTWEAQEARYDYLEERLIAENITIRFYESEGESLQKVLTASQGTLQGTQIDLEGDVRLKCPGKWILSSGRASYDGSGVFLNQEVLLELDTKQTKISSEQVFIEKFPEGEVITLKGDVCLKRREGKLMQYVLADDARCDVSTQSVHFYGRNGRRVLLHDKINSMDISAPEAIMERKGLSKPQFKGIGDVRFHFAEEEYERMKKRFVLAQEERHGA